MTNVRLTRRALVWTGLALTWALACTSPDGSQPQTVSDAWRVVRESNPPSESSHHNAPAPGARAEGRPALPAATDRVHAMDVHQPPAGEDIAGDDTAGLEVLATVNGRTIDRYRLIDLLLRSHGLDLLEQLIVAEAAVDLAEKKGLVVTANDIEAEYERSLGRLTSPLATITPTDFDRGKGEQLLAQVLANRGMSKQELMIVVRRNAYLRKIAESELTLTTQQIEREFAAMFGRRVEIRHIQLGSLQDVTRIRAQLALGVDFELVAKRYSTNQASAAVGGRLKPFADSDDDVPQVFREQAFRLRPGEVSDTIRVGSSYHLLKLDRAIPAESVRLADVRSLVERQARERLAEKSMRKRYEALLENAAVEIHDPLLRSLYRARQRQRNGSSGGRGAAVGSRTGKR